MSTPHNAAEKGDFAPAVLMPGDPLRARYIAEHWLENAREVTAVRGMLGFTGVYRGVPVSVMASGMGMPSIGIYSHELFEQYDVERIVRVGSAGAYDARAGVMAVVLATAAYSESSYARVCSGFERDVVSPSARLNDALRVSAQRLEIPLLEGTLHSSDVFYRHTTPESADYWRRLCAERGCVAVEMESFALFHNAALAKREAACLVTISDSFVTGEKTSVQQRQTGFSQMIRVALEGVCQ